MLFKVQSAERSSSPSPQALVLLIKEKKINNIFVNALIKYDGPKSFNYVNLQYIYIYIYIYIYGIFILKIISKYLPVG